jgi:2Fe-2S ferredoxin
MKKEINFIVFENKIEYHIKTYDREYRNLMFLLKDKMFLEDFGACGGMGRCATCIIKIFGLSGNSNIKDRNEPTTLSKIGITEENTRLACQILITEDLNNVIIEII